MVKLLYQRVVKLIPLLAFTLKPFLLLDVAVVVARIGGARVHHDADQLVVVVVALILHRKLVSFCFLLQVLLGEVGHVKGVREFIEVVDFHAHHRVEIELKSLQRRDQVAGQRLNARPLQRVHFLVTLFALILVVRVQNVTRYKGLEPLNDRLAVFDGDPDREERFNPFILVRTSLADDLVGQSASKVVLNGLGLGSPFDRSLQLVKQLVHVLLNVLLLNHVNGLSVVVLVAVAEGLGVHVLLL